MLAPLVMIVEDDAALRSVLTRGLGEEGFRCEAVATGGELLARMPDARPDALVVDVGLPDCDGRDVCQALRARGDTTPVIFLTARDALVDRLAGFDAGGDDYLAKPFSLDELVARLRALVRRAGTAPVARVGELELDPAAHALRCGGVQQRLTPTEFRILAALLARPGEAVRRRELVRAGWPHGAIVNDNTLDAYIARLRRKLRGLPGAPGLETVHGVGYTIR
ncbi:response regulator transcription factor [Miltoncostaea marina]|uniref:response regulator transcription factor n=1 Tax=Miltoncostaea marina TaxID=2843215 RepID=UPI001C3C7B0E|nr:response regulator transcription factor [Miltoncostaea marina]